MEPVGCQLWVTTRSRSRALSHAPARNTGMTANTTLRIVPGTRIDDIHADYLRCRAQLTDALSALDAAFDRCRSVTDRQHDRPVAPALVTINEAATYLGVARRTVDRLIASGALPVVRVLTAPRIRLADLDAMIREQ
jgi:excisionase family DNA binding protein